MKQENQLPEFSAQIPLHLQTELDRYWEGHSSRHQLEVAILAALASQAQSKGSIDMVLHCPACGLQHIDASNEEEIRIRAAELGVDREGDRAYSDWLEKHEWLNPPHRSHLCASCGHIWRPADVPTNGVKAVKTKGQNDSPLAGPAEITCIGCDGSGACAGTINLSAEIERAYSKKDLS